jgi:hypothetical protein
MNEFRNLPLDSAIVELTRDCLFQLLEGKKEKGIQSLEDICHISRENNVCDLILAQVSQQML